MPSATEQLVKYLTDAHSIEEQALAQLRTAPEIAGDPQLAGLFADHLRETEQQERLVRGRLEAHGASPSKLKDTVMAAGGKGFVLFARSQPDTPGKLTAHAISYENLELAGYELLARVAERAGDQETAEVARQIREQEHAMSERLQGALPRAVDASLHDQSPDDLRDQLKKYLADAHAIEAQAMQLLSKGEDIAGDPELARLYAEHLEETRDQQALVRERLEALGGSPTPLKDAGMRVGALNWGAFFAAQPDTPGKLAAFAFAFEHLEIGGYEQLRRVAERAGDQATVAAADQILVQERAAAAKIAARWDRAVDASLRAVGAAA
ncbi:MAG: ferritin-like domain-containing protein [Solirubrobacteraceae bacterium]|jgi:ferritin-like metal-binding protein YciE